MRLLIPILLFLSFIAALAWAVLWALAWISRRRIDRQAAADQAAEDHKRRLLNPDWAALERHFGKPIPRTLIGMYAARDLIQETDFEVVNPTASDADSTFWFIASFNPADQQTVNSHRPMLESDFFEFADDGMGNPFMVRISGDPEDPLPVYFWMHDGNEPVERVCDSLDQFLRWPRRSD